jgi:hypothetical protein
MILQPGSQVTILFSKNHSILTSTASKARGLQNLFKAAIRFNPFQWDDKETVHKTWSTFKTYFITAIKKKHKHTTGDTGHSERIAPVANQVLSVQK